MKYRDNLNNIRKENRKQRFWILNAIKITTVVLAVAFVVSVGFIIADMADHSAPPVEDNGGGAVGEGPDLSLREGDRIYVYIGENISWRSKVSVEDGVTVSVDASQVNLDKVGTYQVKYTAKDESGNTTVKKFDVWVTKQDYTYEMLMELVGKKAAALGILSSMSKQEQVEAIYKYVNSPSKSKYEANIVFTNESNIPSIDRNNWKNDWIEEAIRTLDKGEGDCYSYYAVSKAFFEYLGIDEMGIRRDDSRSNQSGTHFWSVVNIGTASAPKWYFYDATRLAGTYPDGSNNGCLRTLDELNGYKTSAGASDFYTFDASGYPTIAAEKIAKTK